MEMFVPIAVILLAYLLGGIPFGLFIARAYGIKDIRNHGSGNIGATNVLRAAGPKAAIWVYILDIGKGIVAVLIARIVDQTLLPRDTFLVITALAAVFGHVFPVYLAFKGGKGVNTALGVMLSLLPIQTLICFGIFTVVVAISKFISLGSIIGTISLSAIVIGERQILGHQIGIIYVYLTLTLATLVFLTHWKNIIRIVNGTESRFSLSGGSKKGVRGSHV